MKVLADTSVLIAAIVEAHPAHDRAFPWLVRAREREVDLLVATHTLAETYAVLSTLPVRPRVGPATARRIIHDDIESVATMVEMLTGDYRHVLDSMAALDLSGGVVYDALAAYAAEKSKADKLLTLNPRDFRRAWPQGGDVITEP